MTESEEYPRNPRYGEGCYRRRSALSASEGQTRGELEDDNHAFGVTISHDGHTVTAITPEIRRIPFSTCTGAGTPLQQLIGLDITHNAKTLIQQASPQANCTHLFDLSILAICQTARYLAQGERERCYDILLTDQVDGQPAQCEIQRNGQAIHQWKTQDWQITSPPELAGKVLYKGFREWAEQTFTGDEAEAAFALQKGYFVGNARQYNLQALGGETALSHKDYMYGVCYTYSSPQIEHAVRLSGTVRDFTDTPEQLLRFAE